MGYKGKSSCLFSCPGWMVRRHPLLRPFGFFALYALCQIASLWQRVAFNTYFLPAPSITHSSRLLRCPVLAHLAAAAWVSSAGSLEGSRLVFDLFHGCKPGNLSKNQWPILDARDWMAVLYALTSPSLWFSPGGQTRFTAKTCMDVGSLPYCNDYLGCSYTLLGAILCIASRPNFACASFSA